MNTKLEDNIQQLILVELESLKGAKGLLDKARLETQEVAMELTDVIAKFNAIEAGVIEYRKNLEVWKGQLEIDFIKKNSELEVRIEEKLAHLNLLSGQSKEGIELLLKSHTSVAPSYSPGLIITLVSIFIALVSLIFARLK